MNAGTFSLAMMTPLTRPTAAAPPTPAMKPDEHRGKEGRAAVEGRAQRQRREDRGEAHHPADREIDAGGDDDEGLAEAEQQHRNDGDENVLRVAHGEEIDRAAGRQRHGDDEEQDEQAEKEPRPDAAQEQDGALRRRADARRGRRARGKGQPRGAGHPAALRAPPSPESPDQVRGRRMAGAPSHASAVEDARFRRPIRERVAATVKRERQVRGYLPGT